MAVESNNQPATALWHQTKEKTTCPAMLKASDSGERTVTNIVEKEPLNREKGTHTELTDPALTEKLQNPDTRCRKKHPPRKFAINSVRRTHADNEPRVSEASKASESKHCEAAVQAKMVALNNLGCWEVITRPTTNRCYNQNLCCAKSKDRTKR